MAHTARHRYTHGFTGRSTSVIPPHAFIFRDLTLRGFWLAPWFRHIPEQQRRALVNEIASLIITGKTARAHPRHLRRHRDQRSSRGRGERRPIGQDPYRPARLISPLRACRRNDRSHPDVPVPGRTSAGFLGRDVGSSPQPTCPRAARKSSRAMSPYGVWAHYHRTLPGSPNDQIGSHTHCPCANSRRPRRRRLGEPRVRHRL